MDFRKLIENKDINNIKGVILAGAHHGKVLRKFIDTCRLGVLKKMFTKDEKYLMIRAIEDRIDNLEKIAINKKWADNDNILTDCADYSKLKIIFLTKDWR